MPLFHSKSLLVYLAVIFSSLAPASTLAPLAFDVTLEDDPTSKSINLQQISLACGFFESGNRILSEKLGQSHTIDNHGLLGESGDDLYIKLNGTVLSPNSTSLLDYSSMWESNSATLRALFYIPLFQEFTGEFSCGHNSSTTPYATDINFMLVYVQGPPQSSNICLIFFAVSCSFFILAFLVVLFGVCYWILLCRRRKNCAHSHKDVSSYTLKSNLYKRPQSPLLFTSSGFAVPSFPCKNTSSLQSLDSIGRINPPIKKHTNHPGIESSSLGDELISNEILNKLMRYLTHPSSCSKVNCHCIYYKQKLEVFQFTATSDQSSIMSCPALSLESTSILSQVASAPLAKCSPYSHPCTHADIDNLGVSRYDKLESSREISAHHDGDIGPTYPDIKPISFEPREIKNKYIGPEEIVIFDCKGGNYTNEDHEITLKIPVGAIPEGKTVSIEIGVHSLSSPWMSLLPRGTRPVSPLVKLCVVGEDQFRFLKPVELTLPHYLDISDEEDISEMELKFMKAGHNLYCFHQSDGVATFRPHCNVATLKTEHFCSFCITANQTLSVEKIHYRLTKIVPKTERPVKWRVNFCITYYLRTCLQALNEQFPESRYEMKTLRRFKFSESAQIEIDFERKLAGGWQLALETKDKINADEVEYWNICAEELEMMEEENQYPPRFEVEVSGSQARESVNALISFKGLADDNGNNTTELLLEKATFPNDCAITLPPRHMIHESPSLPIINPTYYSPIQQIRSKNQPRPISGTFSDSPCQKDLINYVAADLPQKWRLMGVQLELSSSKLDEIEASNHGDCIHCFISVFSEWEKRLSSPYSWSTIVDALKAPSIEENKVASELIASLENNYETESLYSKGSSIATSGYATETEV